MRTAQTSRGKGTASRRALFGLLGGYLGAILGFFVGLPLGFLAFLLAVLFGLAGAVAVPAQTRRVRRLAVGVGMVVPTVILYSLVFLVG